jgi:hypothetical protein
MRPDLAFWKKEAIKEEKIKTLWLIDATCSYGKPTEDGRNSFHGEERFYENS